MNKVYLCMNRRCRDEYSGPDVMAINQPRLITEILQQSRILLCWCSRYYTLCVHGSCKTTYLQLLRSLGPGGLTLRAAKDRIRERVLMWGTRCMLGTVSTREHPTQLNRYYICIEVPAKRRLCPCSSAA